MFGRLSRHHAVLGGAAALGIAVSGVAAVAHGPPLTIVSWGGSYTASQMVAYVNPFRETTDRWVRVAEYTGGLEEIREQVAEKNITWDVVDLGLSDARRGCEEGLLEPFDHSMLPDAPDGTPAREDFVERSLQECAVGQNLFAVVVGYDTRRLGDNGPDSISAFFDVEQYPGKRGVQNNPRGIMEWALIADAVAPEEVYDVLDTEEGVERAFEQLNEISRHIVWWEDPATPPRLLEQQRVVMTQTFNGRMQDAIDDGGEQAILWDAQQRDIELWGIVRGTQNLELAQEFIVFASQSERLAEQSREIAYGPARASAMDLLDEETLAKLPTASQNSENFMWTDHQWWAENQERMDEQFAEWRERRAPPTLGVAR